MHQDQRQALLEKILLEIQFLAPSESITLGGSDVERDQDHANHFKIRALCELYACVYYAPLFSDSYYNPNNTETQCFSNLLDLLLDQKYQEYYIAFNLQKDRFWGGQYLRHHAVLQTQLTSSNTAMGGPLPPIGIVLNGEERGEIEFRLCQDRCSFKEEDVLDSSGSAQYIKIGFNDARTVRFPVVWDRGEVLPIPDEIRRVMILAQDKDPERLQQKENMEKLSEELRRRAEKLKLPNHLSRIVLMKEDIRPYCNLSFEERKKLQLVKFFLALIILPMTFGITNSIISYSCGLELSAPFISSFECLWQVLESLDTGINPTTEVYITAFLPACFSILFTVAALYLLEVTGAINAHPKYEFYEGLKAYHREIHDNPVVLM